MEKWRFLDLETSGLTPRFGADIVEVALADENGQPVFESLARPKKKVPKSAIAVHGIKNEYLIGARPSQEVREMLQEECRGANVGIYNAQFDLRFLPDLPKIANSVVCIMKAVAADLGITERLSLNAAAERYGVEWPESMSAHRAMADAIVTARVFAAMKTKPDVVTLRVNGRPIDRFRGMVYFNFKDVPSCLATRTALKRKGLQPGGVSIATVRINVSGSVPAGNYALFSIDEAKPLPA